MRTRFFARPLAFALIRPLSKEGTPLREWSPLVEQRLRAVDRVAVYGKDTLEVIMPELNAAEAARLLKEVTGS